MKVEAKKDKLTCAQNWFTQRGPQPVQPQARSTIILIINGATQFAS